LWPDEAFLIHGEAPQTTTLKAALRRFLFLDGEVDVSWRPHNLVHKMVVRQSTVYSLSICAPDVKEGSRKGSVRCAQSFRASARHVEQRSTTEEGVNDAEASLGATGKYTGTNTSERENDPMSMRRQGSQFSTTSKRSRFSKMRSRSHLSTSSRTSRGSSTSLRSTFSIQEPFKEQLGRHHQDDDDERQSCFDVLQSKVSEHEELANGVLANRCKRFDFFHRVLTFFMAVHPLMILSQYSALRSRSARALLLTARIMSALSIASVFFVAEGSALSKASHQECQEASLAQKIFSILWSSIISHFASLVPILILASLCTRSLVYAQSTAALAWQKHLSSWRIRSAMFWMLGVTWSLANLSVIALFLANSTAADGELWLASLGTWFAGKLLLKPLLVSSAFSIASVLLHSEANHRAKGGLHQEQAANTVDGQDGANVMDTTISRSMVRVYQPTVLEVVPASDGTEMWSMIAASDDSGHDEGFVLDDLACVNIHCGVHTED